MGISARAGLLVIVAAVAASCGARVSEENIRASDRYYDAAYVAWYEERDNLEAIRHLTRSVEANPANDRAHYLLGTLRLGRGELDEAEIHLRDAIRHRLEGAPSALAEAQNSLGVLLIHRKRYGEAVEHLEAASKEVLNREPWLAMGNLGWAYIEMGEHDKAVETLRRALFDQPRFCVGHFRLGQAYYLKGEYEKAQASLAAAVRTEEDGCAELQEAHQLLGMTYLRIGREAEARDSLDRCREIDPASDIGVSCGEARAGL
jgi:tetratricopeptide (TPR) repeat protein